MHITLYIGSLSGGGAEKVACNLANYLVNKGHNVTILTMDDEPAQYELSDRVERIPLIYKKERKGSLYNLILRLKRYKRYLKYSSTDVYLVMLPVVIIISLFMSRFTNKPMIMAERNMPSLYSRYKRFFLKKLWKKADAWCFQTEDQRKWYPKEIINMPTCIIPNAINPDINFDNNKVGSKKEIVSVGRLTSQKNHILLINAFKRISDLYPDYKLVIYGKGPLRDFLANQITKLGLENRVILYGHCKNAIDKIKEASIYIHSSNFEGMPNALMEAMALGLPCISTDCEGGGARFLIENNKNGILIPRNNINALESAMKRLIDDRTWGLSLGEKAKKIRNRLSSDGIYNQWEGFIKRIYNERKTN